MATVPTKTNKYTLGRGAVFFAPFAPGTQTPMGERFFGDVNTCDFTFKSTDLDHYSSVSGIKELDDSFTLQVDRTGQIVTENIDSDNLALFFLGSAAKLTQVVATVTAEVLHVYDLDNYYQVGVSPSNPTGNRGVDPGTAIVVKDSADVTTYTAGTDYVFDYDIGRLYVTAGSMIAPNADLHLTYHLLAATRDQVVSGNTPIEGQLRFVSFNPTAEQKDVLAPWVRLAPNGNFSLIGDKLAAITFDQKLLKKPGYEALYIDGRPVTS